MWDVLLNFDPALLATFVLAGLLLNITPGADFVFISASSIAGGPKLGACASFGVLLGILVHVVAAAAGLSALLIANPAAYDVIRYVGAAYLLFIAWQSWFASGHLASGKAAPDMMRAVRRGFVTNVLNPKTALFIFAFIPQFTDPDIGPVWMQILILGGIFLVNGFIFAIALAFVTGTLADTLRPRVRILNKITAILFGGLAVRLIMD